MKINRYKAYAALAGVLATAVWVCAEVQTGTWSNTNAPQCIVAISTSDNVNYTVTTKYYEDTTGAPVVHTGDAEYAQYFYDQVIDRNSDNWREET